MLNDILFVVASWLDDNRRATEPPVLDGPFPDEATARIFAEKFCSADMDPFGNPRPYEIWPLFDPEAHTRFVLNIQNP